MHSFKSIKVIDSGKSIILQRSDDTYVRYHSTWLRDNALDEKTRDVNKATREVKQKAREVKNMLNTQYVV